MLLYGRRSWQEAPINRQLPEFTVQLPYVVQSGTAVHQMKLVYPYLCQQITEQVHFGRNRTKKTTKGSARKMGTTAVDIKRVKEEIYDLCKRRFRETAVIPIQNFCQEISSQIAKPTARFLPLLIISAAAGVTLGIGIIGGLLILKKGLADQKKEFDKRFNNISKTLNENQDKITSKFLELEELLNIYQATMISQAENHFLPQVVGEVFMTASELVRENVFHERILAYPRSLTERR